MQKLKNTNTLQQKQTQKQDSQKQACVLKKGELNFLSSLLQKEFDRLGQKSKTKSKPGRLNRTQIKNLQNSLKTLLKSDELKFSLQAGATVSAPISMLEGSSVAMSLGNKELEEQISKSLKQESNPLHTSNLFEDQ